MFSSSKKREWRRRLAAEVEKMQTSRSYRELTLNRLKEIVQPPNEEALVVALLELVQQGTLTVGYRVKSPRTSASIGMYQSPFDIPERLMDETTGDYIEIDRYQDVEAVYANERRIAH